MKSVSIYFALFFVLSIVLLGCSSVDKTIKKLLGKEPAPKPRKVEKKIDYGPTNSLVKNGFIEKSSKYGLKGVEGVRFFAVDFDNDNDTDLVVLPKYFAQPQFYKYQNGKFSKLNYNPFGFNIQGSFFSFADFNGDGTYDIAVGTLNQKSEVRKSPLRIFKGRVRNGRVKYSEIKRYIAEKARKKINILPLSSLAIVDYDLDGKLDIFLGAWFLYPKQGPVKITPDMFLKGDRFKFYDYSPVLHKEYAKDGSGNFVNASPTFAVSTCDIDLDGFPDVLTSSSNGYANRLWLNRYDAKRKVREFRDFALITGFAGDEDGALELTGSGYSNFSACADYNNDGIMDVFTGELTHSYQSDKVDRSAILSGSRKSFPPKFIRTPYTHEANVNWSQSDRRGVWGDFNNDGREDLLVDNSGYPPKTRMVMFMQNSDKSFDDVGKKLGIDIVNPSGSIKIDINQDGRLDIISGQTDIRSSKIKNQIHVYENNIPRKGRRSLRFYVRGKRSNFFGLGATIFLKTNRGTKIRYVENIRGPQPSMNEEGALFGLEKGERALSVKIRFPYRFEKGIMERTFDLKKYKFSSFLNLTVCENGNIFAKRKNNCQ